MMSNLFGKAKEICQAGTDENLPSDDDAQLAVVAVYEQGPFSSIAHVFHNLQNLPSTQHCSFEFFCSNKPLFNALLYKFNSLSKAG